MAELTQQLFGRRVALAYSTDGRTSKRHDDLHISFDIKHSSKNDGGSHTVTVFNLNDATLLSLQSRTAVVEVYAGYGTARLIARGTPVPYGIKQDRTRADCPTTIEFKDGYGFQSVPVNLSFKGRTRVDDILRKLKSELSALGLTPAIDIHSTGFELYTTDGVHLTGNTAEVLRTIARLNNLEIAYRDGNVVLYRDYTNERVALAPIYSSAKGNLVNTPTMTKEGVDIQVLLDPTMRPGRRFKLESKKLNGMYVARDVEFKGDSGYSNDFTTRILGVRV